MANSLQPLPLSSINGTLDLFTGVLYYIRILSLQGLIRPAIPSANGGIYLEQDIFPWEENSNPGKGPEPFLWYFHPSSKQFHYQWGLASNPSARVRWTSGDTEQDDFPLQLWNNSTDFPAPADFMNYYEDSTSASGLWNLEPVDLTNFSTRIKYGNGIGLSLIGSGYRMRGMNMENPVTFSVSPKSLRGWWLRIPNGNRGFEVVGSGSKVDRFEADEILVFQPTRFKLYAEIETDLSDIMGSFGNSERIMIMSCDKNVTDPNFNYKIFIKMKEEKLFEGVTLTEVNGEKVVSKFFDFERKDGQEEEMKLEGTYPLPRSGSDKMQTLSSFDKAEEMNCASHREEFQGFIRQFTAKVTGVADMLSSTGTLVSNVLVEDPKLLEHLITSRGYKGRFLPGSGIKAFRDPAAHAIIPVKAVVRGRVPFM